MFLQINPFGWSIVTGDLKREELLQEVPPRSTRQVQVREIIVQITIRKACGQRFRSLKDQSVSNGILRAAGLYYDITRSRIWHLTGASGIFCFGSGERTCFVGGPPGVGEIGMKALSLSSIFYSLTAKKNRYSSHFFTVLHHDQ